MLYIGYVKPVAFAFAVAAMPEGRLDARWARWTRPWTTLAWLFLTVGIALGSWWAYYGSAGAAGGSGIRWRTPPSCRMAGRHRADSFARGDREARIVPKLDAAALDPGILAVPARDVPGPIRALISVHAFASDPGRGIFILTFLGLCIGGSLALYAWRAGRSCARAAGSPCRANLS